MFFESKIKANKVRKQMLVLECDTQRLLNEERWRDLRRQVRFGKGSLNGKSGRWQQVAALAAPVGAFFLTRWLRRKEPASTQQERSATGDYLSLLGSVFEWMGRFHRS